MAFNLYGYGDNGDGKPLVHLLDSSDPNPYHSDSIGMTPRQAHFG